MIINESTIIMIALIILIICMLLFNHWDAFSLMVGFICIMLFLNSQGLITIVEEHEQIQEEQNTINKPIDLIEYERNICEVIIIIINNEEKIR